MAPPGGIACCIVPWARDIKVVVLDIGVDFRDPAAVQHVTDFWQALALVEHEAVVVLGVHCERGAVHGVHDVGIGERSASCARAAGFPTPLGNPVAERPRHLIELVPDGRRDPRSRDQRHQDDDRDDHYVLDCRLPLRAAGKSGRYPPPKGISAACMCGSSRIALADAAKDRRDY